MAWTDFDAASGLERDVLRRTLPALPSSGQSYARATLDPEQPGRQIAIGITDTLGATPEGCVERLKLRPLLTGTAWKVLDQLLEEALDQAGVSPDRGRGYSIKFKQKQARAANARPTQFATSVWAPLMGAYNATVEIRHSLVHRRVHTDPTGALVGVDDARSEARLLRYLTDLASLHGHPVTSATAIPDVVPELTVIVDPDPASPGRYLLDLPDVRARNPFSAAGDCADLIVAPRDRPGQELYGLAGGRARGRRSDQPRRTPALAAVKMALRVLTSHHPNTTCPWGTGPAAAAASPR